MNIPLTVLISQMFSTFAMFGLIWLIQIVHYPTFKFIDKNDFRNFTVFHTQMITYIVGPLMLIEAIGALYLVLNDNNTITNLNFLHVILIWISTAILSVPLHNKLYGKRDLEIVHKLIKTNWPRTIMWSTKSIVIAYYFYKHSTF